ncbi:MAG: hypothetical protein NTW62_02615 [Candidatus Nomurabacteria bacterium]|nr:hypothetical protein [Candidatus Nomurabacteria bacterium]
MVVTTKKVSTVVDEFYTEIENMMKRTSEFCKDGIGHVTVDQAVLFSERYGICTHPQYYILILDLSFHLDRKYQRTHYILNAIINDKEFQKAGIYWANVLRHVAYRYQKDLTDNFFELHPVIKKSLEMRLTESENKKKLLFLSIGWMLWIQHAIPSTKRIGGSTGHKYYSYWDQAEYFITFLPVIKRHVQMFKEALFADLAEDTMDSEDWEYAAKKAFADLSEYNDLMFEPLIKDIKKRK